MAGGFYAEDMQEMDLVAAVALHCSTRCYPAPPSFMQPVIVAAVEAMRWDDPQAMIELPDGIEYHTGATSVEAWRVIESFRADDLI